MPADCCHQLLKLLAEKPVESLDLVIPELQRLGIAAALTIVLAAGNLIDDLVDQRLGLGHRDQTRIRRRVDLLDLRRTPRDQDSIELVVLRPLPEKLRVGTHLRGLEHDDNETIAAKLGHHLSLIAAARLDANASDLLPTQPMGQFAVTFGSICDPQPGLTCVQRNVEIALASIDTGALCDMLLHLLRTFLECEP